MSFFGLFSWACGDWKAGSGRLGSGLAGGAELAARWAAELTARASRWPARWAAWLAARAGCTHDLRGPGALDAHDASARVDAPSQERPAFFNALRGLGALDAQDVSTRVDLPSPTRPPSFNALTTSRAWGFGRAGRLRAGQRAPALRNRLSSVPSPARLAHTTRRDSAPRGSPWARSALRNDAFEPQRAPHARRAPGSGH